MIISNIPHRIALLVPTALLGVFANDHTLDQFNYDVTDTSGSNNIYGPPDWSEMQCPDIDTCEAWRDKYKNSQGWHINSTNHCVWCPAGGGGDSSDCATQHNSPINTERNRAIVGHPLYNQCIDRHWMSYFDSSCSFDELRTLNAFTIERASLRITQPMTENFEDNSTLYKIACQQQPGTWNRWGRIDFPKGFSQWWLLSHIDFKVPSEHYQEGKQYAGELQLHHFYSVSGDVAGVNNQLGTVAIFLEVYDDAPDWPILNRIICAWREAEEKNRETCGYPSVKQSYPGCITYTRDTVIDHPSGTITSPQGMKRRILRTSSLNNTNPTAEEYRPIPYKPAKSAHDVILENLIQMDSGSDDYQPKMIHVEKENLEDVKDFDWSTFLAEQIKNEGTVNQKQNSRRLMNYEHVKWFNYFPMIAVRTEYYFRYSGSQTIPPCYGKFQRKADRAQTNHWRVMKDPIRVSQRQIDELHRLLKDRIAPQDAKVKSCKPDTAAGPDTSGNSNKVTVARPLQETNGAHFMVFCECSNWGSKWEEDRRWCRIFQHDQKAKFYTHPYNFDTVKEGF